MTSVRNGLDAALAVFAALAWGFAAFAFGSRWFSPTVGGIVGLTLCLSALALALTIFLQDSRLAKLVRGTCPRCRGPIAAEHRHRRWEPALSEWSPPLTAWDCRRCAFSHSEGWACPSCPGAGD